MKLQLTLRDALGELNKQVIDIGDGDPGEITAQICDALFTWTIVPGDTILITEA